MPLVLLGLILIMGIVIYGLVIYGRSEDKDSRPLGERVSHFLDRLLKPLIDRINKGASYTVMDEEDEKTDKAGDTGSGDDADTGSGSRTMFFPADAESEKRKRNIH